MGKILQIWKIKKQSWKSHGGKLANLEHQETMEKSWGKFWKIKKLLWKSHGKKIVKVCGSPECISRLIA